MPQNPTNQPTNHEYLHKHTHTHTHTRASIYLSMCVCVCVVYNLCYYELSKNRQYETLLWFNSMKGFLVHFMAFVFKSMNCQSTH